MHTHNAGNLKSQIEARKLGKTYIKMTDEEYALNRKLLETMKNSSA